MVPQTDLVPTLALLLGIPIPYSSVGQVMLQLFPSSLDAPVGLSQVEALWINVKQVRNQRILTVETKHRLWTAQILLFSVKILDWTY